MLIAHINRPQFSFGSHRSNVARDRIDINDVLLKYLADINSKSDWWAGG